MYPEKLLAPSTVEIGMIISSLALNLYDVCLGTVGSCIKRKALASHQGDPGSIPGQGHMWVELCVGSLLCHEGFPDHPVFLRIIDLSILAVLHGHNGLMWLAAKCALACLLLEHVVAASFAIQLLAASKDD